MKRRYMNAWTAALAAVIGVLSCSRAHAEINTTRLAVPAIGTSGVASTYPSTINITAPQGPNFRGDISVQLIGVTHPCPRELAVMLVRNNTDAYPLMYNSGGCRPMQGTLLTFITALPEMIAENPAPGLPPFGSLEYYKPSGYGTPPVFPAPAPQINRPLLPAEVTIEGEWSLYVMDTGGSGRGVIEGGWALIFPNHIVMRQQTTIDVTGGPARRYPLDFDLSGVNPDVRVDPQRMGIQFALKHERPRDLQIVLESPTRERVVLMANAGGDKPVDVRLLFLDFEDGLSPIPERAIPETRVRVGGAYGTVALPPSAPSAPYAQSFDVFRGIPVAGVWKLWVYDTEANYRGEITDLTLFFNGEYREPKFLFDERTPVIGTTNQPFARIGARTEGLFVNGQPAGVVTYRVTNNNVYYASGTLDFKPGTDGEIAGDVPLKKGENTIVLTGFNGYSSNEDFDVDLKRTVNEFTYALAEGATGDFFDLDVTVANAGSVSAPIAIDFLPEDGPPVATTNMVAANGPLQVHGDDVVSGGATSTVVRSLDAVPLVVERTMSWDARGYGGHGGGAVSPHTRWLFAEGAQGVFFKTYVLLANDNAADVPVTVKFLLQGGGVVTHNVTVPARSRHTVDASTLSRVVDHSFGLDITAAAPIIAERAMYFSSGTDRRFDGGHESAGVNETSTRWFLAEGATGPFFDCFVLLSNPNPTKAQVTLTYLLPDGATIAQNVTMAPNSRETINVEGVATLLANAAVSTMVTSDIGIVAERAMYWPDAASGWREAHNSFGVTETGLRWGIADGRVGGDRDYVTYLLLANPNPHPAEVQVRFLQAGVSATRTYTLPPTSRLSIQTNVEITELRDGLFGAEIQVLNYQPIAVEKALYWNAGAEVWAAGTNVTGTRLPPR